MIGHEPRGMTPPIAPLTDLGIALKKRGAIDIVKKDVLPRIAPCGDMIQSPGIFNAVGTSHEESEKKGK